MHEKHKFTRFYAYPIKTLYVCNLKNYLACYSGKGQGEGLIKKTEEGFHEDVTTEVS